MDAAESDWLVESRYRFSRRRMVGCIRPPRRDLLSLWAADTSRNYRLLQARGRVSASRQSCKAERNHLEFANILQQLIVQLCLEVRAVLIIDVIVIVREVVMVWSGCSVTCRSEILVRIREVNRVGDQVHNLGRSHMKMALDS